MAKVKAIIEDVAPYVRSEDPNINPRAAAEDLWRHLVTSSDDLARVDISGSGVNFTKGLKLDNLPDNVVAPYLVNDADDVINQVIRRYQRDIGTAEHFGTPEWTVALNEKKNLIHQEFQDQVLELRNTITDPVTLQKMEAKLLSRLQKDISELDIAVDEALGKGPKLNSTVQSIKAGTSGMFLGRSLFANVADLHATKTIDIITKYVIKETLSAVQLLMKFQAALAEEYNIKKADAKEGQSENVVLFKAAEKLMKQATK